VHPQSLSALFSSPLLSSRHERQPRVGMRAGDEASRGLTRYSAGVRFDSRYPLRILRCHPRICMHARTLVRCAMCQPKSAGTSRACVRARVRARQIRNATAVAFGRFRRSIVNHHRHRHRRHPHPRVPNARHEDLFGTVPQRREMAKKGRRRRAGTNSLARE